MEVIDERELIKDYVNDLKWEHQKPIQALMDTIDRFQDPAFVLAPQRGGVAIWSCVNSKALQETPFSELMIRDEGILSRCGMESDDTYYYLSVKYDVKNSRFMRDVLDIGSNFYFCKERETITAIG